MRRSSIYLFVLGIAVAVGAALAGAGLVATAQNSNSSTTTTNSNTARPKPRRHKPKAEAAEGTAATETTKPAPKKTGRCDPTQQEQTDLSGTYTGKLKHGDEGPMDATLTVTGNSFTMTAGSNTHSGRITAVTTCGYTAVTVMPEGGPQSMSLRAKKVGDNLTLTSVAGEPQHVMFWTGGGAMKPKPKRHKAKAKTTGAAATPTPKQ